MFYTDQFSEEEIKKNLLIPAHFLEYAAITRMGFLWKRDELLTILIPNQDFYASFEPKITFTNPLIKKTEVVQIVGAYAHPESGLLRLKFDKEVTVIDPLPLNNTIDTASLINEEVELISYGFPVLNQSYRPIQKHIAYTTIDNVKSDAGIEIVFKRPFSEQQADSATRPYSAVPVEGDERSLMLKRVKDITSDEKLVVVGILSRPAVLEFCEDYGKTASYIPLHENLKLIEKFFAEEPELWTNFVEVPLTVKHISKVCAEKYEYNRMRFDEMQCNYDEIKSKLSSISGGASSACYSTESPSYIEKIYGMLEGVQQNLAPVPREYFNECSQSIPFNRKGEWTLVGGIETWGKKYKVRGFSVYKNRLFASVDTELWAYDGERWELVLSLEKEGINNLIADESYLYLTLSGPGGGVRIYGKPDFPLVDEGLTRYFGADNSIGCYSLCKYNDELYVGCDPAEVFKLVGNKWQKIGGDGLNGSWTNEDGYGSVYDLKVYKNKLYAAMARKEYGPLSSSIWCFDGSSWERIGGEGLLGSWSHPHICYVLCLQVYNDLLFASLTRPKTMAGSASSVYAFDGEKWFPIGLGRIPHLLSISHIYNYMLPFKGRLYLATGDMGQCKPAVWELSSCSTKWQQVAGGPNEYGWPYNLANIIDVERNPKSAWIYKMSEYNNELYVGMAGNGVGAQVWKYSLH